MRLTVPLNPDSLAHWSALARPVPHAKPASVTLPGDPRRYAVAGLETHHHPDPERADLDIRLVEWLPLTREQGAALTVVAARG